MAILQQYYTSYRDESGAGGGYKVKAMSPGLSSETQARISHLIYYKIPIGADVDNIRSHPVALRYYLDNPHESLLICSQSCGTDENGRPGNFFAHTLALPPDAFTAIPPILYWRGGFWKASDSSTRTQIPPIADLDELGATPTIELEDIWRFLAKADRRDTFRKLVAAVIHSSARGRRVIIYDAPDTVALWVAAVSCALPPLYRPLLTFATYHNNPYQAPYLITGTTAGTDFHNYPEEYLSYFIINGETGMVSNVEESAYANEAALAMRPEEWENRLIPLLDVCTRRFPPPTRIDEQLDLAVAYHSVFTAARQSPLDATQLASVRAALAGFNVLSEYHEDDRDDARQLADVLMNDMRHRPDGEALRLYGQTLEVLHAHDDLADQRLPANLNLVAEHFVGPDLSTGQALYEMLRAVFGPRAFVAAVNTTAFLGALPRIMQSATPERLGLLWSQLLCYAQPGRASAPPLLVTMRALRAQPDGGLSSESAALLARLREGIASNDLAWLTLAVESAASVQPADLAALYYGIVARRPLDARAPYRQTMRAARADIALYELCCDLRQAGTEDAVAVLVSWAVQAREQQISSLPWLATGLEELRRSVSAHVWSRLAARVLVIRELLAWLPSDMQPQLLSAAFSTLSFANATDLDVALCRTYMRDATLTRPMATMVVGVLAMASGQLDHKSAAQLRARFERLAPDEYSAEFGAFAASFFAEQVTRESHGLMVEACYLWDYRDLFWQTYWAQFTGLLLEPRRAAQVVDLLSFWFDSSLSALGGLPYVVQTFFLDLQPIIDDARKERTFRDAAREISAKGAKQPWYPLVQDYFAVERRGILGLFGR
ncbi:MAG: hypothetical protein ACRDHE_02775 [Ktedonobacterales bacterium]